MTKPIDPPRAHIVKTLTLTASPPRVWRALTDPSELVEWFPDESADVAVTPGGEGAWVWANHGAYAVRFEVVEPHSRLVWSWARDPNTALVDTVVTTVEFRLEPSANGGTVLHLSESGFVKEADRQGNEEGWAKELGELAAYLKLEPNS